MLWEKTAKRRALPKAVVPRNAYTRTNAAGAAGCGEANVAESDRVRKTANEASAGKVTVCDGGCHKQLYARRLRNAIVAESDRVRICYLSRDIRASAVKATAWKETARANAADSGRVRKDCEKRMVQDCRRAMAG